jgi:hypothetical protein
MTTKTITALYDTYDNAAQTVRDLAVAGVPDAEISVVANNVDNQYALSEESNAAPDAGAGAAVGSVLGGGAGLLAGLGLLAIPGVGPVVAAGWLVSAVVGAVAGAGAGAATGGIIGSLTSAGVSSEHAHVYAEGVRRGGTLVTARVDEPLVAAVEEVMRRHRPIDPDTRGRAYRDAGWNAFDQASPPYTAEELERERERTRDLIPIA